MAPLDDLPEDILNIIFTSLPAASFLALCRACKELSRFQYDSVYWRTLVNTTFRLFISPLLKADGVRWYHVYRRLSSQTRLYTWGQGIKGNLGPGMPMRRGPTPIMRRGPPRPMETYARTSSTWPTKTHVPNEIKVIADLQCGGFSTSILSSDGKLYVVGIIDSMDGRYIGESVDTFTQLHYLTESTSAIAQFSSGRRHILALTDDGEVLSWDRTNANGLKVLLNEGRNSTGKAVGVVAGWGESSAYVPETGIVYWTPIKNDQQGEMLDGVTVQAKVIPGTARASFAGKIVDVVSLVVLEGFIVWLTTESKLFACELLTSTPGQSGPDFPPFEVPGYTSPERALQDLQGQFNKFAVLTKDEVFAGNCDYLKRCANEARAHPPDEEISPISLSSTWDGVDRIVASRPPDIPALQHSGVIKVAFGDHHYHALHANGTITSYGTDSQSCGALGLGYVLTGGRFRGLRPPGNRPPALDANSMLVPAAQRQGRQVWFEPEKRDWLSWLEEKITKIALEANPATQFQEASGRKQYLFSEWVEQEGRHWNDGPLGYNQAGSNTSAAPHVQGDFLHDPYFTIAIAACGWHSGALVLVDDEKAEETRKKWTVTIGSANEAGDGQNRMPGHYESGPSEPEEVYIWKTQNFPRIRLPDGDIMPSHGEVREWRDGMPAEP